MEAIAYRFALWLIRVSLWVNGRAITDVIDAVNEQAEHAPEDRSNKSPWH